MQWRVKIFTCCVFCLLSVSESVMLRARPSFCLSVRVAALVEWRVGHLPDRAQLVVMAAWPRLAGSTQSPGDRRWSSLSSCSTTPTCTSLLCTVTATRMCRNDAAAGSLEGHIYLFYNIIRTFSKGWAGIIVSFCCIFIMLVIRIVSKCKIVTEWIISPAKLDRNCPVGVNAVPPGKVLFELRWATLIPKLQILMAGFSARSQPVPDSEEYIT